MRTDATCTRGDPEMPAEEELPDVLPPDRADAPLLLCPPDVAEPLPLLLWPLEVAEPLLLPLPDAEPIVPDDPTPLVEDDEDDSVPVTSTWCPTCCCMFCPSSM